MMNNHETAHYNRLLEENRFYKERNEELQLQLINSRQALDKFDDRMRPVLRDTERRWLDEAIEALRNPK